MTDSHVKVGDDEPVAHEVTVKRVGSWFVAYCSCGYESRLIGFPGKAEAAGLDHKNAKEDR